MKMGLIFLLAIAVCFFGWSEALADGKLDKFKKDATGEKEEKKKLRKNSSKEENSEKKLLSMNTQDEFDDDDDEDGSLASFFLRELFGLIFEEAGEGIFTAMIKDHGFRYRAYPYSKELYAYRDEEKPPRGAAGVVRAEYQRISSDIYALGWRITVRAGSGFDISAMTHYYEERMRFNDEDHMSFTKLRISYLVTPLPTNMLVRVGAGIGDLSGYSGFDVGAELDWFPYNPLVFRAGISHSIMRRGTGVTDVDTSVGIMAGPVEFALGYRGLFSQGEDINGLYFSIGFWF